MTLRTPDFCWGFLSSGDGEGIRYSHQGLQQIESTECFQGPMNTGSEGNSVSPLCSHSFSLVPYRNRHQTDTMVPHSTSFSLARKFTVNLNSDPHVPSSHGRFLPIVGALREAWLDGSSDSVWSLASTNLGIALAGNLWLTSIRADRPEEKFAATNWYGYWILILPRSRS